MLTNLQAMRAFAAISVVLFHFALLPATALPVPVGAFGVDLFFVLSGFIIAHSAARSSRHFLAHRLIRVLPPYWIATLLASLPTWPMLGAAGAAGWLGQSLLFLTGPGGRPPLIFVGWTLVYELGFYLLFWLALRLGTRRAPLACLPLLLVLAVVPVPGVGHGWPLLVEFAFGLAIFLLIERTAASRVVPAAAGLALASLGVALLIALPSLTGYQPSDYRGFQRVVTWGLPAALVVAGLILAERGGWALRNRVVLLLGAASYAIYLLHPIAVGVLLAFPAHTGPAAWLTCAVATLVVVAVAVAFHRWVEAPLLRRLRGLLHDRPAIVEREPSTPPPTAARAG